MMKFDKPVISCYDNGRDVIVLYRENNIKKKKIFKNYPWYFAIKKIDGDRLLNELKRIKKIKVVLSDDYYKIYLTEEWSNDEKRRLRYFFENRTVQVLEFDCSLTKKFVIDNNIQIDNKPKIAFFDIEIDDSTPGIEIGRDRILSWSICDRESGKLIFKYNRNEKILLKEFFDTIKDYDVISGWNSKFFDWPYIQERAKKHNITYNENEIMEFDLMNRCVVVFKKWMSHIGLPGFSLEEVSQTFLNEGKLKIKSTAYLEKNDLKRLEDYNKRDVELLSRLDKKLDILDLVIKECCWTGTFLGNFSVGELLDNYILREARKHNKFLSSKRYKTENKILIAGSYVMAPKKGLYENIRVFDFKSLYPTIIVSFNISHDTILDSREENTITTANEYRYSKKEGIYSGLIKALINARKEYTKKMIAAKYDSIEFHDYQATQETVKELTNAMYGICAEPNSRFFDKRIAESITLTGQYIIKKVKEFFEKDGYDIKYADTDSVFISIADQNKINEIQKKVAMKLKQHLIKKFNLDNDKYIINLQYEKTYNPIIFVDKKRYAGLLTETNDKKVNKIFTRGLENMRKDSISYTRKRINELLKFLLIDRKDINFFIDWITNLKKEFFTTDINIKELIITKKISKPISEYKLNMPHIRLAAEMIKQKKILDFSGNKKTWGQKIEYLITGLFKKKSYKQVKAVHIDDFDGNWDRIYYWNVYVFRALKRILDSTFSEYDWSIFIDKDYPSIIIKSLYEKKLGK